MDEVLEESGAYTTATERKRCWSWSRIRRASTTLRAYLSRLENVEVICASDVPARGAELLREGSARLRGGEPDTPDLDLPT